jgi:hypothetical protein
MSVCVALDMDETLGRFAEASGVWEMGATYWPSPLFSRAELETFIMTTPHLLRPDMKDTLELLAKARRNNKVSRVVLYTNNTAHREWPDVVAGAMNRLVGEVVVDQVVAGYGNETRRTAPEKTFAELCTAIGSVPRRCVFIDDQEHVGMRNPSVTYVRADPHTKVTTRELAADSLKNATAGRRLPSTAIAEATRHFAPEASGRCGDSLTWALARALDAAVRR